MMRVHKIGKFKVIFETRVGGWVLTTTRADGKPLVWTDEAGREEIFKSVGEPLKLAIELENNAEFLGEMLADSDLLVEK